MAKILQVSFVLDETGSMEIVKQETISGFNEYIDTLKKGKNVKDIRFTLTQFDSEHVNIVYDSVAVNKVAHRDNDNYRPGAMTPLYDAVGKTIRALEKKVKGKKQSALLIIQTDGEENASREYSRDNIFKLIDEKKNLGWTFVFLGANQDRYLASQNFGIPIGNTMTYTYAQTPQAFASTASSTSNYVSGTRGAGGTSGQPGAQTNNFYEDAKVIGGDNTVKVTDKPKKEKKNRIKII